jgi:hypothetical protein
VSESLAAQKRACPSRHEQPEWAIEASQRRQVEVVEVQVGDQYRVDVPCDLRVRRRGMPPDMSEARPQHRVGEQTNATELEEHGGVSDEGEPVRR